MLRPLVLGWSHQRALNVCKCWITFPLSDWFLLRYCKSQLLSDSWFGYACSLSRSLCRPTGATSLAQHSGVACWTSLPLSLSVSSLDSVRHFSEAVCQLMSRLHSFWL